MLIFKVTESSERLDVDLFQSQFSGRAWFRDFDRTQLGVQRAQAADHVDVLEVAGHALEDRATEDREDRSVPMFGAGLGSDFADVRFPLANDVGERMWWEV